jgi:RNA polymerase sigma-70 factor (ECF subfamily)
MEAAMRPTPAPTETPDLTVAFEDHAGFVRGRLRKLGVPAAELDDACQDVFLVLARRLRDYDSSRPLQNWLAGIARRVAGRYRSPTTRQPRLAVAPSEPETPEELASKREAWALVESFVDRLDADRWEVFVRSEIEGLRGSEIARQLGINQNTVYSRLRSARTDLDRVIARHHARDRGRLMSLMPVGWASSRGARIKLAAVVASLFALAASVKVCGDDPISSSQSEDTGLAERAETRPAVTSRAPADPRIAGAVASAGAAAEDSPEGLEGESGRADGGESWHSIGSGTHRGKDWDVSTRYRYRTDGKRLVLSTQIVAGDHAVDAYGEYLDVEGLELVDGTDEWTVTLQAGETRRVRTTLRATGQGCVRIKQTSGYRPPEFDDDKGESSLYETLVFEDGEFREPKGEECVVRSTSEPLTGETITVHLVNGCDEPVDYSIYVRQEGERPPISVPERRLDAGEAKTVTLDRAQWVWIRTDDGSFGSAASADVDGSAIILGSETSCNSVMTMGQPSADDLRPGLRPGRSPLDPPPLTSKGP